tara:strand:+ start:279 stop:533 length:255 start_codon:yes stop_codon:yes gene_type:complete
MVGKTVKFFGAAWCGDCVRSQALLEHHGVDFSYHDVDSDENIRKEAAELSGRPNIPVLLFPDGSVLTEPNNTILEKKLFELKML